MLFPHISLHVLLTDVKLQVYASIKSPSEMNYCDWLISTLIHHLRL